MKEQLALFNLEEEKPKFENEIVASFYEKAHRHFRHSFINEIGELILIPRDNVFTTMNFNSEKDMKAKVINTFSRDCIKGISGDMQYKMTEFCNDCLGVEFTHLDYRLIYRHLGNGINQDLTYEFIDAGLNLDVLRKEEIVR